jgi:hypothetical protein
MFGVSSLYWGRDALLPDGLSKWVPAGAWFVLAGVVTVVCTRGAEAGARHFDSPWRVARC